MTQQQYLHAIAISKEIRLREQGIAWISAQMENAAIMDMETRDSVNSVLEAAKEKIEGIKKQIAEI